MRVRAVTGTFLPTLQLAHDLGQAAVEVVLVRLVRELHRPLAGRLAHAGALFGPQLEKGNNPLDERARLLAVDDIPVLLVLDEAAGGRNHAGDDAWAPRQHRLDDAARPSVVARWEEDERCGEVVGHRLLAGDEAGEVTDAGGEVPGGVGL